MNKKLCRLPNEKEIALANINQRKQALAEVKKDKKKSDNIGYVNTTGDNKENATAPQKKR